MKGRKRLVLFCFLALVLAALPLLAAACGDDDDEEETKELVIAMFFDLSGPTSPAAAPFYDGIKRGLDYFNEVEGGVDGAKITVRWVDTQAQVTKTLAGFDRIMREEPKPVLGILQGGVALAEALRDKVTEAQVPFILFSASKGVISPPGYFFVVGSPYEDHFAAVADYIVENWTEARSPKIAHIGTDDAWGRAAFPAFPYAEEKGVEISTEFMSYTDIDVVAQLLRIRDWGADYIYIHGVETQVGLILKDADRLGMIGEVQFIADYLGWAYDMMEVSGDAADGMWQVHFFVDPGAMLARGDPPPGLAEDIKMAEHIAGSFDPTTSEYASFMFPRFFRGILADAADRVGIDNLDGTAIYNMLDSGYEWDTGGSARPFSFEPGKRVGMHTAVIHELRDGEVHILAEPFDAPRILEP